LHDSYISILMTVNRFGWLLSHIHLNNNSLIPKKNQPGYDKLYKIIINLREEQGGDVQDVVLKKRKLERSGYVQYAMFPFV